LEIEKAARKIVTVKSIFIDRAIGTKIFKLIKNKYSCKILNILRVNAINRHEHKLFLPFDPSIPQDKLSSG
jgi:hypothetical protein